MSAEWIQGTVEEILASDGFVDLCVPHGTAWNREERIRAAFSIFLLGIDPDADLFHIRTGEEISVNYALPAVAKLYAEFAAIYERCL